MTQSLFCAFQENLPENLPLSFTSPTLPGFAPTSLSATCFWAHNYTLYLLITQTSLPSSLLFPARKGASRTQPASCQLPFDDLTALTRQTLTHSHIAQVPWIEMLHKYSPTIYWPISSPIILCVHVFWANLFSLKKILARRPSILHAHH